MIRRVQQRDKEGCGVACVAMVTGMTYLQAKKFFLEAGVFTNRPEIAHSPLSTAPCPPEVKDPEREEGVP